MRTSFAGGADELADEQLATKSATRGQAKDLPMG
jgi:hypothetical protein